MYVRLLKPWKACQPGKIFSEMAPNMAEILVNRGIAEVIDKPPNEGEPEPTSKKKPPKK